MFSRESATLASWPGSDTHKPAGQRRSSRLRPQHRGLHGQELAQFDEWNEHKSVGWGLLEYPVHKKMQEYVRHLNHFYRDHPALWQRDGQEEGFEWINCHSYKETILAFIRKSADPSEDLLVVCNFTPVLHEDFWVGVPYKGKFKEIFNSDDRSFGGGAAQFGHP